MTEQTAGGGREGVEGVAGGDGPGRGALRGSRTCVIADPPAGGGGGAAGAARRRQRRRRGGRDGGRAHGGAALHEPPRGRLVRDGVRRRQRRRRGAQQLRPGARERRPGRVPEAGRHSRYGGAGRDRAGVRRGVGARCTSATAGCPGRACWRMRNGFARRGVPRLARALVRAVGVGRERVYPAGAFKATFGHVFGDGGQLLLQPELAGTFRALAEGGPGFVLRGRGRGGVPGHAERAWGRLHPARLARCRRVGDAALSWVRGRARTHAAASLARPRDHARTGDGWPAPRAASGRRWRRCGRRSRRSTARQATHA